MLRPIDEIRPEQDEVSILASLFSRTLLHNEIQMTDLKSSGGKSNATLLPYEIAHCSYEPDNLDCEDTKLLQEEILQAGQFQSDFSMHEMHPGNFSKAAEINQFKIPTLFTCIKHAFTLPHIKPIGSSQFMYKF